ncbi:MAG: glycosyltransferase, partial [Acidobacteriia bacterium]|nr:glycosyltransferase [Terriglobia bacterium]
IFAGYVPLQRMASLYAHAAVFVFSSLLEACPNTLIEAMGCGAAIVASDTEPNREVAGSAVIWCDGREPGDMARAMLETVRNRAINAKLRAAASERSKRFSWERSADELVKALERAHSDYLGPARFHDSVPDRELEFHT